LLTISPQLLGELKAKNEPLVRKLNPEEAKKNPIARLPLDEKSFRWLFNENAMATEKTAEGIRLFHADAVKLQQAIAANVCGGVADGHGRTRTDTDGDGRTRTDTDGHGRTRTDTDGHGRTRYRYEPNRRKFFKYFSGVVESGRGRDAL